MKIPGPVYVVEPDQTVIPSEGTSMPYRVLPTPAGLASNVEDLLKLRHGVRETTIVVSRPPNRARNAGDLIAAIKAAGCRTDEKSDTGWFTLLAEGERAPVHLCVREWTNGPVTALDNSPQAVFELLWWWARRVGTHYRHTPGSSATAALRNRERRQRILWRLRDPATVEYWQPPGQINEIRWDATLLEYAKGRALNQWDMRSAYLAAAAAVTLPLERLKPTGTDPHPYGYYRIRPFFREGRLGLDMAPYACRVLDPDRLGTMWVTHPMLALWNELGWTYELVDSVTSPDAGRLLRGWAEDWRDHLAATPAESVKRELVKAGYTQTIGMFANRRGLVYRPDWRHMIIDHVRASLLRRIHRVYHDHWMMPVRINVDSVYYLLTKGEEFVPLINDAIGVGDSIGNMRYVGEAAS